VKSDLPAPERMTKRWKAPRFSGTRSPSREGAGTETLANLEMPSTPVFQKKQRRAARRTRLQIVRGSLVGDTVVLGRVRRRGALAMREPFTRLCRPGEVPWPASLVARAHLKRNGNGRIFLARRAWLTSSEVDVARTQKKRSPARGWLSEASGDNGARECARTSNLVCRSR